MYLILSNTYYSLRPKFMQLIFWWCVLSCWIQMWDTNVRFLKIRYCSDSTQINSTQITLCTRGDYINLFDKLNILDSTLYTALYRKTQINFTWQDSARVIKLFTSKPNTVMKFQLSLRVQLCGVEINCVEYKIFSLFNKLL